MEEQWQIDRARLRKLRQQYPEWKYRQCAEELNRSYSWVKKWCKRFKGTDPDDETVIKGLSRRPHNPPPSIAPEVVKRILAIRDDPPAGLQRVPGPVAIKYYLQEAEKNDPLGHYLPRSSSTIWGILDRHNRIIRPLKGEHEPVLRANPMAAWQIDFKDITTVSPEPSGKQAHVVEVLDVIDSGTSVLLDNPARPDFNAETAIESLVDTLRRWGCPKQITLDRDPRFVGSWSGRDFPTPLVRFLACLNIEVNICPPRRPDKNCFVERYHRTYTQEGIEVYRPVTLDQVIDMNLAFAHHYNYQRPNQAITCGNQPPRQAFPNLPQLPALPDIVDPDHWLQMIDGQRFKRRVISNGTVKVDKHRYYVGRIYHGRYVLLRVDATNKQFIVELNGTPIKERPIKGLENGSMSLKQYLKFIRAQAVSDWRHFQQKTRRYV